jgi:hypothetical protein
MVISPQYGSLCFGSLNRYESQLRGSLKLRLGRFGGKSTE